MTECVVEFRDAEGTTELRFVGTVEPRDGDVADACVMEDGSIREWTSVVQLTIGPDGGTLTYASGEKEYVAPGVYLVANDGLFQRLEA